MTEIFKYYAGIGSRETPKEIMEIMSRIATHLEVDGYTLRSGGAPGADTAFSEGCMRKQIFVPWRGFQNLPMTHEIPFEAYNIAAEHHPIWPALKPGLQKLMARNTLQILGPTCNDPSEFVLCWTQDGITDGKRTSRRTGGTGQALRVAAAHNVPIYNLNCKDIEGLVKHLASEFNVPSLKNGLP